MRIINPLRLEADTEDNRCDFARPFTSILDNNNILSKNINVYNNWKEGVYSM